MPDNPFFRENVARERILLGLPDEGVPASLVHLCDEWLKRRGPHPSGGLWPLAEYGERATKPDLWQRESIGLAPRPRDEMQGWLVGVIYAFGLPKQLAPCIRRFVIDNDVEALRRDCEASENLTIEVDWKLDKGIIVTLIGIEPDISIEEWKQIYERVKPQLPKRPYPGDEPELARERKNFDRDLFFFVKRYYDGMTYDRIVDAWNELHPEARADLDDASIRQASRRMINLLLPHKEYLKDYDEKKKWLLEALAEPVRRK